MKERASWPMKAWEVRAILAGSRTQARRVVKPVGNDEGFVLLDYGDGFWPYRSDDGDSTSHTVNRGGKTYLVETPHSCPYGQPGDRLWVRESGWERPWRTANMMREGADTWPRYTYAADDWDDQDRADFKAWGFKSRPSIHMPRWASRILLEIVSVRVERLQDISEEDARAEGISDGGCLNCGESEPCGCSNPQPDARDSFFHLWMSINGEQSLH